MGVAEFVVSVLSLLLGLGTAWFALTTWKRACAEKRAEMLGEMLRRILDNHHDMVMRFDSTDSEVIIRAKKYSDSEISKFLIDISYVCYLYNHRLISDDEIVPFKPYINVALENGDDNEYKKIRGDLGGPDADSPIYDLLMFAEKAGYAKHAPAKNEPEIKEVNNNVKAVGEKSANYKTHIEVLNTVFGLNLTFHMRGAHRLNNGALVWFPRIVPFFDEGRQYEWQNVISSDGNTLQEYWPVDKAGEVGKLQKNQSEVRIVYAYNLGEDVQCRGYKYVGIFKYARRDERNFVYLKVADEFNREEFGPNKTTIPKSLQVKLV